MVKLTQEKVTATLADYKFNLLTRIPDLSILSSKDLTQRKVIDFFATKDEVLETVLQVLSEALGLGLSRNLDLSLLYISFKEVFSKVGDDIRATQEADAINLNVDLTPLPKNC